MSQNPNEVLLDVAVEDGKYRYVQTRGGSHVYRHGELWQDVSGNKMLYCFAAEVAELREQLATARAALERIERWHGEFPATGKYWNDRDGKVSDNEMSYAACYGSNGERDFIRSIARAALAPQVQP